MRWDFGLQRLQCTSFMSLRQSVRIPAGEVPRTQSVGTQITVNFLSS